jgi:hypothetical protein
MSQNCHHRVPFLMSQMRINMSQDGIDAFCIIGKVVMVQVQEIEMDRRLTGKGCGSELKS